MTSIRNRWTFLLSVLAPLLFMPVCALAQEFRATVNGRATDPSEAAIPGATAAVRSSAGDEAHLLILAPRS